MRFDYKLFILYDILMNEYLKQNENISSEDLQFDTGSFRNPENYHSIQHHFPKTYAPCYLKNYQRRKTR